MDRTDLYDVLQYIDFPQHFLSRLHYSDSVIPVFGCDFAMNTYSKQLQLLGFVSGSPVQPLSETSCGVQTALL